MKHLLFYIFVIFFFFVSCNKTNSIVAIPDGIYKGTFQRQVNDTGLISQVAITISESAFSGQSEHIKYPALCHGSYQIQNDNIIAFQDSCVWTAEFDWSLILSGNFQMEVIGDSLELTRQYTGLYKDVYKLVRQPN